MRLIAGKKIVYNSFHNAVVRWYTKNGRALPWRSTHNPYNILVSEIMLQQTQVNRVVEHYQRWLKQFPTVQSLAHASRRDVLLAWSGLGYNNRAIRFQQLARRIVTHNHSKLPQEIEELQKLPGIGIYTAHAVACFAFLQQVPVVDVNVKRILTRWTRPVRSSFEMIAEHEAWNLAEQFLPQKKAYVWNQALMDIGSLFCTARNPHCLECPVRKACASAFSKSFLQTEKKKKKIEPKWKGIPRRLYRGRILKLLHHQSLSAHTIASLLWKKCSVQDVTWTERLLTVMRNDGLLEMKRNKYTVAE